MPFDNVLLVLGNQLFDPRHFPAGVSPKNTLVFMREDMELCTYFRFHKQKLWFFLSAMRGHAAMLREKGYEVVYESLETDSKGTFEESLVRTVRASRARSLLFFEIEDRFFESRIHQACADEQIGRREIPSPMFLTSRAEFAKYLASTRKPFMKTYYESQRRRLGILLDATGGPVGGQWSFDAENRKPLPENVHPPVHTRGNPSETEIRVKDLIRERFADHPGDLETLYLPSDRAGALRRLQFFVDQQLASFGPYEDALAQGSDTVFHSVLTPFLNTGLLTPEEVIREVLKTEIVKRVPIESLEGFVRQVIGWREFIRGIYRHFDDTQQASNFWNHDRRLSQVWYKGGSSLPQLERVLEKVFRLGYCHHIERLMVLGNLMLLLRVHPREAYRWFMEMFVDSSDWVMGPNVYGMALMSDGGTFATKPYICGSNYWRKMSREPAGPWCDGVDGLYWQFIETNASFFRSNPRLSMMVQMAKKIPADRRARLYRAADRLTLELTE